LSLSKNEIKFIQSLQQKKFRDTEDLFVVEGIKLFQELITSESYEIEEILILEDSELIDNLKPEHALLLSIISQKDLERISGLKQPNQVLAVVKKNSVPEIDHQKDGLILFLDDIKDPGNLGTIIRTAEWFGVHQIICSTTSVELYNPKVVQASMGSLFRMNICQTDLIEALAAAKKNDFQLLCADMKGENLHTFDFKSKTALIMGSESHGVSDEIRALSQAITIPKYGSAESLNVAMACGIIMSYFKK
jgi:TrmH family RNA methyltransferase